jgi:hypothetical protein
MKVLALTLALLAVPAVAQAASKHVSHAARAAYGSQREIACSVVGCMPVPPGCHRATGRTFDGTPTGFDIADCGRYTLYGIR